MTIAARRLAGSCRQADEACARIGDWIDGLPEQSVPALRKLRAALDRGQRRCVGLAGAAIEPPCLGIVGPPGSARTALVRDLVAGDRRLVIQLDDPIALDERLAAHDGTGFAVKVRYTSRPAATAPHLPVLLDLLTPADIVQILTRIHLAFRGEEGVPDADSIRQRMLDAGRELGVQHLPGLTREDVAGLRDDIERHHFGVPLVEALAAGGYWEQLGAIVSHLRESGRTRLLSLLWGDRPELTALYGLLVEALERTGFAGEVMCPLDAIDADGAGRPTASPSWRGGSILHRDHVLSLHRLQPSGTGVDPAPGDVVRVRTRLGTWTDLERTVLAALAGEVRLPLMAARALGPDGADVVEFPAIEPRIRAARDDGTRADAARRLAEAFLREKSTHVLAKAIARHEITALAVCLDGTAADLGALTGLVDTWVEVAQGADPVAREACADGLFLLAGHGASIYSPAGLRPTRAPPLRNGQAIVEAGMPADPTADPAGDARIAALARASPWFDVWASGQPFAGIFVRRDAGPGAPARALAGLLTAPTAPVARLGRRPTMEHATDGRQLAMPPGAAAIAPPATAVTIGDHDDLRARIAAACNSREHTRQITDTLNDLKLARAKDMVRTFASFDPLRRREWRLRDTQIAAHRLTALCRQGRLGKLMDALLIGEDDLACLFEAAASSLAYPTAAGPDKDKAATGGGSNARDHARTAVAHWGQRLAVMAGAGSAQRRTGLPPATLSHVVAEIVAGAERHDIVGQIGARLGWMVGEGASTRERARKSAVLAANIIATFVTTLGCQDLWSAPGAAGPWRRHGHPALARGGDGAAAGLGRRGSGYERAETWVTAFVALTHANVAQTAASRLRIDRDRQIADLLETLGSLAWELDT